MERRLMPKELAEQTGLSSSALGSYEADDSKDISHYALAKLAKFYGVTADYFLGLTETKRHPNADLAGLRLSDAMIDVLKEGRVGAAPAKCGPHTGLQLRSLIFRPSPELLHIAFDRATYSAQALDWERYVAFVLYESGKRWLAFFQVSAGYNAPKRLSCPQFPKQFLGHSRHIPMFPQGGTQIHALRFQIRALP